MEAGSTSFFTTNVPVKNKAHIGDGIDIQAQGAYVIVPPSIHPDTNDATSGMQCTARRRIGPQPLPTWLETLLAFPVAPESPARDPQAPILEGRGKAP